MSREVEPDVHGTLAIHRAFRDNHRPEPLPSHHQDAIPIVYVLSRRWGHLFRLALPTGRFRNFAVVVELTLFLEHARSAVRVQDYPDERRQIT